MTQTAVELLNDEKFLRKRIIDQNAYLESLRKRHTGKIFTARDIELRKSAVEILIRYEDEFNYKFPESNFYLIDSIDYDH